MKKIAFILFYMAMSFANAADVDESLEPCINGGVSSSGNYSSQEQEDARQHVMLEPCINGGVSASGNYVTQQKEDYVNSQLGFSQE